MPDDAYPRLKDITIILIRDGVIYGMDHTLVLIPIDEPFRAIGSGGDYAMGPMACGKTPMEAVAVAARFEPNTGCGTETIQLSQRKPSESR